MPIVEDVDLGEVLALLQLGVLERCQLRDERGRGGARRPVGLDQLVPEIRSRADVCHRHGLTMRRDACPGHSATMTGS